jgi:hypothetical protein
MLCFHVVPPGDLDPMMPKNNRVLPYMMTNISAKFQKISVELNSLKWRQKARKVFFKFL